MKMRRLSYILIAALAVVAGCNLLDDTGMMPVKAPQGERVKVSFKVAVPTDGGATKALDSIPVIDPDGFYVAVFGGSGYFNEWVKATVEAASVANYDGSSATVYDLSATFTVSDSRLRLHLIANCPESVRTSPPISGSTDNEENVISKIRSQISDTYSDGYWQKVILPNGIRAEKINDVYVATSQTMEQFPDPVVMVRNFARVYLRNLTPIVGEENVNEHQLVRIIKYGLAYAPSEGVIAPILSAPYNSDNKGYPIDTTGVGKFYFESFFINYQNYPIASDRAADTLLTGAPFNYRGYSPSNQAYDYYPSATHPDREIPLLADLHDWDSQHPENNVLYVYERTIPSAARRATRVIIQAERVDQNDHSDGVKFYALDIVNNDGVAIPLLRNQSYTVHLLNIEAGSGETDISKASKATSATVTGDPNFQNLINISDGKSSIGTSFTEKFYVQPQLDSVMFRYIPTNIENEVNGDAGGASYAANTEGHDLVTVTVGSVDTYTGAFTELTPSEASSQGILAFKYSGENYNVWIVKDGSNKVVPYVRSNNRWVPATAAQIADQQIEKWGMIKYELNDSYKDADNYFTQERVQGLHVTGRYNGREISRNVIIKTSPRQTLIVNCQQKYVPERVGEQEVLQIKIPAGLSRSVFPLEFTIEAGAYSLTPDGDILPVSYGASTISNNLGPAFYFVKTLTQAQYDALSTVNENGAAWKVFECRFKTTVAQNASSVYVKNRYFKDEQAHDQFYNFTQRKFTWTSTPQNVYRHGYKTFEFEMDAEHGSYDNVWWDPENLLHQSSSAAEASEKGLSPTYRVLPPVLTVTMNGCRPQYKADGETPETPGLVHDNGNNYLYYVGTLSPRDKEMVELKLEATGAIGSTGSITLSTANLADAQLLYAQNTTTFVIQGAAFENCAFDRTYLSYGIDKPVNYSFSYVEGLVIPITITLTGLTLNGADSRMVNNGDGTYTFTPTSTSTRSYTLNLKATHPYSSGTVKLEHNDYETKVNTISRHWTTGSYTIDFTDSDNYSTTSFSHGPSGITVNLTNSEGKRDGVWPLYWSYRKNIGNSNGNGIISISSEHSSLDACKLTGATITYFDRYSKQNVSASIGTISNAKQTWTASSTGEGNGDTSVDITMVYKNDNNVNAITRLVVTYGYYE